MVKETIRERASKIVKPTKKRRLKPAAKQASGAAISILRREFYLPLPDSRTGRFLNKRRHIVPRFFRESFQELKKVTWPSRKETWKLTTAVFLFAIIFGLLVALVDFGLDKIFRSVLLK